MAVGHPIEVCVVVRNPVICSVCCDRFFEREEGGREGRGMCYFFFFKGLHLPPSLFGLGVCEPALFIGLFIPRFHIDLVTPLLVIFKIRMYTAENIATSLQFCSNHSILSPESVFKRWQNLSWTRKGREMKQFLSGLPKVKGLCMVRFDIICTQINPRSWWRVIFTSFIASRCYIRPFHQSD